MVSALYGAYECRVGCGRVLTMPGARVRHEKVCVRSFDDLVRVSGLAPDALGNDECWSWPSRFPRVKIPWTRPWDGEIARDYVYRIAYYLAYGELNVALLVCHTCDNGQCFNPTHLFQGTNADNLNDMRRKGRDYNLGKRSPDVRRESARKAGMASAAALSPTERSERARRAANARYVHNGKD